MSAQLQAELYFEGACLNGRARSAAAQQLRDYLTSLLMDGFPPSLSLAVVDPDGVQLEAFGGYACVIGAPAPTTAETSYDVASLTKVVCTVTLLLVAHQQGLLTLDDPVARWLPEYPQERTTLRHLLTHTAGLVDHKPFYATLRGRAPIEAAVYAEAGRATPAGLPSPADRATAADRVRYSDLGYMLLGWALEACLGRPLDEAFVALVAAPLGLPRARFRPVPAHLTAEELGRIAATELDGDQRLGPGLVWGEVHDGNAYALGGVAGHAGLFAPLADLARFVRLLLIPDGVLSAESITLMSSRQAGVGEDVRGLGWRLEPQGWGTWLGPVIWHTGFTGTSLLVAPEQGVAVVLLTNAVHPHRRLDDQATVRARVHQLVAEAFS